ncbi:MAG: DUF4364 family protein [Oscillospiraceae bacterium]|jgi:predicted transcriptional regulator
MDRFGFIHDKLDIKILILFILRRLPDRVDENTLADLVLCDDGISYFDYTDCIADLVANDHVTEEDSYYRITEKGSKNCEMIESSLPYTVRATAENKLAPVVAAMRRSAMIKATHEENPNGGCTVTLSMSDGVGEIISLRLLTSCEEQAKHIEKNFRSDAEGYYTRIVELLAENQ